MSPQDFVHTLAPQQTEGESVSVAVLMPNGLLITVKVHRDCTVYEVKEEVFDEAQRQPRFGMLHHKETYVFNCNNALTYTFEELLDESRRLSDVRPFLWILKLVARKKDKTELHLKSEISQLIGKGLHEFDALTNSEVNDFRWRMKVYCEEIEQKRFEASRIDKLMYLYSCRTTPTTAELPKYLSSKLPQKKITIEFRFYNNIKRPHILSIEYDKTPEETIERAITDLNIREDALLPDAYVLKVSGFNEFLFGSLPLIDYKYIREQVAANKIPSLVAVLSQDLRLEQEPEYVTKDDLKRRPTPTFSGQNPLKKRVLPVVAEDFSQKFVIKLNNATRINCCDDTKVAIEVGLYHGGESLCDHKSSADVCVKDGEASWSDESIPFDIEIGDLPRMCRLCFVLLERKGNKSTALTWANITVYDFRGYLRTGCLCLSMWRYSNAQDNCLKSLGTVVPNPNQDEAITLTVTFERYTENDTPIIYDFETEGEELPIPRTPAANGPVQQPPRQRNNISKSYLEQLKQISERDPLTPIEEQDKELLWFLRDCSTCLPEALPHVLNAVKWNERKKVKEMMPLLDKWPLIRPELALTLLDYAYADARVRRYAVSCLHQLTDEDLSLYLLQLVQALKYESYHLNELSRFLLFRALNSRCIGQELFWVLRAEMHSDQAVSVVFGLMLEAYCYGAKDHIKLLMKQMDAMNKLQETSDFLKEEVARQKASRDKQKSILNDAIKAPGFREVLKDFVSPLDPRLKLKSLKPEKCNLMDSKMRPMWLVFSNEDFGVEDSLIIYKNGDDLRQDMLTIQMLRLMDKLWKDEGYDFRLTPYRCLTTGYRQGLIEVVQHASTIANVMKEKGVSAVFKKGSLLSWLKDKNPDDESLMAAINEFSLSCAGYCVATYVLGIGDRHSDNLMLKDNGQLLHIDFGHILGNFKEKFGYKREVPFLLVTDFIYVITKGQKQNKLSKNFQEHCEKAFLILRRKGPFIISLFAMMLESGMPELSSTKDLEYLRNTLVLDAATEAEALKNFRENYKNAIKKSWKTTANWFAHYVAKDNN